MQGFELLQEQMLVLNMGLLLLLGGLCSLIFKRLKMPVVIGYLVSGIIIAYFGWNTVDTANIVDMLSDIGLALLMFCIGMELNLNKLKRMGSSAIAVVLIMAPIVFIASMIAGGTVLGLDSVQSIVFAAVMSGSSTAVVVIVLGEQKGMDQSDIESLILVLVVEDVFQVVMLSAITPLMQGNDMAIDDIVWMVGMIIVFMMSSIIVGITAVPKAIDYVHRKMPKEVVVVISLGLCFALSYISVIIGLSMAIGAFLAGVITSQAKQSRDVEAMVTPMKDVFMMMFFISIGLQISIPSILDNLDQIAVIYVIYFVVMVSQLLFAFLMTNKPARLAYKSAIALTVMGEFAFIISKEAFDNGIFDYGLYTSIVGAALVSMIVLPIISRQNDRILDTLSARSPKIFKRGLGNFDMKRQALFERIQSMSSGSRASMKKRLATAYANVFIILIIEIVFIAWQDYISEFVYTHTQDSVTPAITAIIILILNFVILLMPIHALVVRIKYLTRTYLNAYRRKPASSTIVSSSTIRTLRYFSRGSNFLITAIIAFAVSMIMPVDIDLVGRLCVAGIGALLAVSIFSYKYVARQ